MIWKRNFIDRMHVNNIIILCNSMYDYVGVCILWCGIKILTLYYYNLCYDFLIQSDLLLKLEAERSKENERERMISEVCCLKIFFLEIMLQLSYKLKCPSENSFLKKLILYFVIIKSERYFPETQIFRSSLLKRDSRKSTFNNITKHLNP